MLQGFLLYFYRFIFFLISSYVSAGLVSKAFEMFMPANWFTMALTVITLPLSLTPDAFARATQQVKKENNNSPSTKLFLFFSFLHPLSSLPLSLTSLHYIAHLQAHQWCTSSLHRVHVCSLRTIECGSLGGRECRLARRGGVRCTRILHRQHCRPSVNWRVMHLHV